MNFLDGDAPNLLSVDARTGQPAGRSLQHQDLRLRGRATRTSWRSAHPELRRQRAAQPLRHHDRARRRRTATSSAPTSRTSSSSTSSAFAIGRPRGQVRQHRRPGVLAPRCPRCSSPPPRTPSASRTTAPSARRPPSTTSSTSATVTGRLTACARWPPLLGLAPRWAPAPRRSVTRSVGSEVAADRRAQRPRAEGGVAHRLRDRLHGHVQLADHRGARGVHQRHRRQHQLHHRPLPEAYTPTNPPPGWDAALANLPADRRPGPHLCERAGPTPGTCLPARVHVPEPGPLRKRASRPRSTTASTARSRASRTTPSRTTRSRGTTATRSPRSRCPPSTASTRREREHQAVPGQPVRQLRVRGVLDGRPGRRASTGSRLLHDGQRQPRREVDGGRA